MVVQDEEEVAAAAVTVAVGCGVVLVSGWSLMCGRSGLCDPPSGDAVGESLISDKPTIRSDQK